MRNMVFKILGNLHVVVVGERDPSPADWDLYMEALQAEEDRGIDVSQMRTLVFSDGGGPNAAQRKRASDFLHGRTTPIAIMTRNVVMRGIVTALSWFNPACRAFAPEQLPDALKFIGIQIEIETILKVIQPLEKELGIAGLKVVEESFRKLGRRP